MARPYTLRRRAERQAETRRRIVEAAVALHGTLGPARTTVSLMAERAGVQRHTVYDHFPDERSILLACSGHVEARDPLPDAAPWRAIADSGARLRTGLSEIYDWYARHAGLLACILRDAEHHAPTREIVELRFGPPMIAYRAALGETLNQRQQALLAVALGFHTWRTLAQEAGLDRHAAAALMADAIGALS